MNGRDLRTNFKTNTNFSIAVTETPNLMIVIFFFFILSLSLGFKEPFDLLNIRRQHYIKKGTRRMSSAGSRSPQIPEFCHFMTIGDSRFS